MVFPDTHRQQDLYRILKAYTIYRPDEGYCQAQAPVAAVLLMHMPAEVSILWSWLGRGWGGSWPTVVMGELSAPFLRPPPSLFLPFSASLLVPGTDLRQVPPGLLQRRAGEYLKAWYNRLTFPQGCREVLVLPHPLPFCPLCSGPCPLR